MGKLEERIHHRRNNWFNTSLKGSGSQYLRKQFFSFNRTRIDIEKRFKIRMNTKGKKYNQTIGISKTYEKEGKSSRQ